MSAQGNTVVASASTLDRVTGFSAREIWPFCRAFDYNSAGITGHSRIQQGRLICTGPLQEVEHLKFLFDQAALLPLREHGI